MHSSLRPSSKRSTFWLWVINVLVVASVIVGVWFIEEYWFVNSLWWGSSQVVLLGIVHTGLTYIVVCSLLGPERNFVAMALGMLLAFVATLFYLSTRFDSDIVDSWMANALFIKLTFYLGFASAFRLTGYRLCFCLPNQIGQRRMRITLAKIGVYITATALLLSVHRLGATIDSAVIESMGSGFLTIVACFGLLSYQRLYDVAVVILVATTVPIALSAPALIRWESVAVNSFLVFGAQVLIELGICLAFFGTLRVIGLRVSTKEALAKKIDKG